MNKLPVGVHNHIFRFLSHTAADAIREIISEFHAFSSQHESTSQLHTFYIFSFWTRRSATRSRLWTTCTSDWGGGVQGLRNVPSASTTATSVRAFGVSTRASSLGTSC